MRAQVILLSLLCFCSRSSSQACSRELLENVDFPGNDIIFVYSPDVTHCQLLCTHHPECSFFTFIRPDWTQDNRHFYCYLKSVPTGLSVSQTPLIGVTSGYSLKPCNPDSTGLTKPCLSQVYHNVDFAGADYRSLFTHDYDECQRVCTQDPHCQFFTYATNLFKTQAIRQKCHLKFSFTIPRTPNVEVVPGITSGFSHDAEVTEYLDTACRRALLTSTDIPGSDLLNLKAASPEHCQALCTNHPLCTYFSFVSGIFTCYLKNNANELVVKSTTGITSGLPGRFCQLDTSWLKVSFEGIDFRGSDISFELMDDAAACQETCTADPNCQFYAYITRDFQDRNYWGRCYLKRSVTMPAPPKVVKTDNLISGFSLKNCL